MAMATANVRKHLTGIQEWQKLGEANIFPPGSRLELIEGEILEMAPIGSNHAGHLKRLTHLLSTLVSGKAIPVSRIYYSSAIYQNPNLTLCC